MSTQNSKQKKSLSLLRFRDSSKHSILVSCSRTQTCQKQDQLPESELETASNHFDTPLNASTLPATTENIRCVVDVCVSQSLSICLVCGISK